MDDLYNKYKKLVVLLVYRATRKFPIFRPDAEDLIQDCWLYIYSSLKNSYNESKGSFTNYLYKYLGYFLNNKATAKHRLLEAIEEKEKVLKPVNEFASLIGIKMWLKDCLGDVDSEIMKLHLGLEQPSMCHSDIAEQLGNKLKKEFSREAITQRVKRSVPKLRKFYARRLEALWL